MSYKPIRINFFEDYVSNQNFEETINKYWSEKWLPNHFFDSDKKELFHYSSLDGLQGIIEEREIWFSHILSMNDPNEIGYGRELVNEKLDERIKDEDNKFVRSFLDSTKISTSSFGRMIHQTFVACFCESPEILSQWRSYGDFGGGYCLGFSFSEDTKIHQKISDRSELYRPYLRKVIYSKDKQIKLVNDCLDLAIESLKTTLEMLEISDLKKNLLCSSISAVLSNILIDMILSFKVSAFEEEKEWRLLRVITDFEERDIIKFRRRNNELIPYISSSVIDGKDGEGVFALSSLYFGPTLDKNSTANTLKLYLNAQKLRKDKEPKLNQEFFQVQGMNYDLR